MVVPFPTGHLMPRLRYCLVCLIAAVVLGTSSSSVPLLLVSHQHHLVCHSMLLCLSSLSLPSPHALHRYCPMHLIPITSCPLSPSPCVPRCHCPAPLIAVALLPSSLVPCSPRPLISCCLWPVCLPSNTRASTCGILDPVEP